MALVKNSAEAANQNPEVLSSFSGKIGRVRGEWQPQARLGFPDLLSIFLN
jgi:hypothetical protein